MNQPWMYMCPPSRTPLPPPSPSPPRGCPSTPALSALFHTLNLDWWSISHTVIYIYQCCSLRSSHPLLLPQSPKVCSLHLCLFWKWSESESHSVVSDSLPSHGLYSPWNSPGQNTGVGSLSLLQGIFPTQGSNPGHSHRRWIFYQLSHILLPCILVRWMKLEPVIQSEVS